MKPRLYRRRTAGEYKPSVELSDRSTAGTLIQAGVDTTNDLLKDLRRASVGANDI